MKMMLRVLPLLVVGLVAIPAYAGEVPVLKSQKDKVNYGIGVGVARNFQRQGIEADVELVIKGIRDALAGGNLLLSEEELRSTMNKFQAEMRVKQEQARRLAAVDNKKAGDEFLAENKKKAGVVTLPSGLQYKVIKAGIGKKPMETDKVELKYRGTLIDGSEFDNSERSGQPTVTLELKSFVAGVKEALKLMTAGSQWQLFVPSPLAYGPRGSGLEIGPNATLIFDMELIAIK